LKELWEYTVSLHSKDIWNDSTKILPYLNEWLKSQRWSGLSSIHKFQLVKLDEYLLYNSKSSKILGLFIKLYSTQEQKFVYTYHIPIEITRMPIKSKNFVIKLQCMDENLFIQPGEANRQFFELILEYLVKEGEIQSLNSNKICFTWFLKEFKNIKIKSTELLGDGGTTNTLFKVKWSDNSKSVCKIYRILTINPEVKMLSTLYSSGFHNVPRPFGYVSITIEGENLPLMLFSEFVESIGDGGTQFWSNINEQMKSWDKTAVIESDPLESYCRNLGEIVSDFHYHSSIINDDLFTPETLSQVDIAKWKAHIEDLFNIAYQNCADIVLDENYAQSILDLVEPFLNRYLKMESWELLDGTMKIKIHQDLHLSQMLTNSSSDGIKFVIIDFEGDPLLPPKDKFQKDPIFRDLAAICSAFHYIKYNALEQFSEQKLNIKPQNFRKFYLELALNSAENSNLKDSPLHLLINLARKWETQCQQWFIKSYLHQSSTHELALNLDFTNLTTFQSLLYLFRIERLIKELYYESLFRKQNVIIPIIGFLENQSF